MRNRYIKAYDTNKLEFQNSSGVTKCVLSDAGKLGINNPSPVYMLDVNGLARMNGLITSTAIRACTGTSSVNHFQNTALQIAPIGAA